MNVSNYFNIIIVQICYFSISANFITGIFIIPRYRTIIIFYSDNIPLIDKFAVLIF